MPVEQGCIMLMFGVVRDWWPSRFEMSKCICHWEISKGLEHLARFTWGWRGTTAVAQILCPSNKTGAA